MFKNTKILLCIIMNYDCNHNNLILLAIFIYEL